MLVLSNEDITRLLTMQDCMAALEPMYRDYVDGRALLSPRADSIMPTSHEGGTYAFKQMSGGWPAQGVQALRVNSDIVTYPTVEGKRRRVKQPLAGGRWVGLVLLFSTETGALLGMFPDGVMQRLRVGAASGLALKHLAREDVSRLALIGSGWQAGAQLMAARAARNFREVRVYSPRRRAARHLPPRTVLAPLLRFRNASKAPTSSSQPLLRWSECCSRSGSSPACTSAASRTRRSTER
jgi:ornithine cyclodeaminase/alanine dehydrogenase-like protein (mu-crystallin family)